MFILLVFLSSGPDPVCKSGPDPDRAVSWTRIIQGVEEGKFRAAVYEHQLIRSQERMI